MQRLTLLAVGLFLATVLGCSNKPATGTTDPLAKLQLDRVLEFYRSYINENKKPPADEKTLKDYIRSLPADRKQGYGMTEDLDQLFTSPRDKKPFIVRYMLKLNPAGDTEAVAWETDGMNGSRFVALSIGYVEEYNQERFSEIKQK